MSAPGDKGGLAKYLAQGGVLLAIAYLVIPLVFGQRIEVSPFLLFAIVFVSNIVQELVPEPAVKRAHTPLRLFCTRLALSLVLALLLVAIYRIARSFG